MTKSSRPCFIVANWKMNKTVDQALAFIDTITPIASKSTSQVLVAVPFTAIKPATEKAAGTKIIIGAQNMNDATEGAYTGEVSAIMLKDVGARFVILGHSERRRLFQESNEFINRKVKRALQSGIQPLLCIGETFEERQAGQTEEVLKTQLEECLQDIEIQDIEPQNQLIVAYEPIWAIGSGMPATAAIAQASHAALRSILATILSEEAAEKTAILYGGSVNPDNSASFLHEPDVDGLLIGNASLKPESFAKIIELSQNGHQ